MNNYNNRNQEECEIDSGNNDEKNTTKHNVFNNYKKSTL